MPIKNKKEYQRKWLKARRDKWIQENGPCKKCGSYEELEVDHIDRSTKSLKPSHVWSLTEVKRLEELKKCQVLCSKCHKDKTATEKITVEHGLTRYRNGCKCEICKREAAEYKRKRRAQTKFE